MAAIKITHEELREELRAGKKPMEIAEAYNMTHSVVLRRIKALKETGYDPDNDRDYNNPENHPVAGYSTLVRHKSANDSSTGKVLEWVKTRVDVREQMDAATAMLDTMISDIKPLPVIPFRNKVASTDQFTVIPIGDPHIGLMTWSKEVGEDWDIKIADRVYRKVFKRLLSNLPDTEECILVNTGDFFHADNIQGETSRSKHKLDLDGRHGKWLDAGFVVIRMFIDACLRKYKKVEFINVPGNHDDILGRAIGSYVWQLYRDNPRITVQKGDSPFQYVKRGKVLLGFAHGHTCRLSSLPGKMADDQFKLWGKTTYRHWITGHVHHNSWTQFKEHPGCKVETVGIIPPKDAYAHGGAYGAARGIQGIIFDKKIGYSPKRIEETVRAND
ncbi:hypothetical protein NO989_04420 [Alteromonas sp. DY56-G5]|uniref:hypothetical protein n=1 Tax=Alteromonas sp. DY56-G5 TaxID=2967128 RepID=UPI00352B2A16